MSDMHHQALREPTTAIAYTLGRAIKEHFADRAVLEVDGCSFGVEAFSRAGMCELQLNADAYAEVVHSYCGPEDDEPETLYSDPQNTHYNIEWNGHSLEAIQAQWPQGFHGTTRRAWIVAATAEVAREFYSEVCRWNDEVRGEVLVFDGGGWSKSKELFSAIKSATFDNLILAGHLKDEILSDLTHFFDSRETYQRYKVPWKRGILLIGPPGNGKTHTVKALINNLGHPCLYVKSFKAQHYTDHHCIRSVFARARKTTPCLLVMEDLDSLIDGGNRSYFLNELDGFEANTGIVVLATTNHPEKLDRSILERPSRFDRKYHFTLPALSERVRYARLWNESLESALRLTPDGLERISEMCEGFTFAYLKELFLSSTMAWIHKAESQTMDDIMAAQVESLREQMESYVEEPIAFNPEEEHKKMMMEAMKLMNR